MRDDIATSLLATGTDFADQVWPRIGPALGGGMIRAVETVQDGTTDRLLDLHAGIDYVQIDDEGLMRGIAVRIQAGHTWDTFTIREKRDTGKDSELAKRKRALIRPKMGYLFPGITVQAYLDASGELASVGVARTYDLIKFADTGEEGTHFVRRSAPNATFLVVDWDAYKELAPTLLGKDGVPAEVFLWTWRRP